MVTSAPSGNGAMDQLTCGFCGTRFREDRSQPVCQGCPLNTACGLIRCPSCGYENPRSPRWLSWLKGWGEARTEHPPSKDGDA